MSWPAAKLYTTAQKIKPKSLDTCARGLMKLGINPDELRPGLSEMVGALDSPIEQTKLLNDLAPWLSTITQEQRELMRRVCVSSTEARMRIIDRLTGFSTPIAPTPSASEPGRRTAEELEEIERLRLARDRHARPPKPKARKKKTAARPDPHAKP